MIRILFPDTILFPRYHTSARYGEYLLRTIRPNSKFWHTSVDGSWLFEINRQGFRNTNDFRVSKPVGCLRIICLGDSNTQGYEVKQESTFPEVLGRKLRSQGYEVEVYNTGISGFSNAEELLYLENEGIRYSPDIVVLGFYANDFEDNVKTNLFELRAEKLFAKSKEYIPGVGIQDLIYSLPLVKWLGENSFFYSLLFNYSWNYYKQLQYEKRVQELKLNTVSQTDMHECYKPVSDLTSYQELLARKILERLYKFCKVRNIPFVILDVPRKVDDCRFSSSLSDSLKNSVSGFSDLYVDCEVVLEDYQDVVQIHVPHGHTHISEFTHSILGVSLAKHIVGRFPRLFNRQE